MAFSLLRGPTVPSISTSAGVFSPALPSVSGYTATTEDSSDISQGDVSSCIGPSRRNSFREEEDGDDSEVFLSIIWGGGKLGAAYYSSSTAEIHMLKDTAETDSFVILNKVWQQVRPKHIVTSTKADERFLKAVSDLSKGSSLSSSTLDAQSVNVEFLPSIEYSVEVCKRRIMSMQLASIPDGYSESERTLFLSSAIPFDCVCLVRALGGLLKYLEKRRVGVELESMQTKIPLLSIKTFSLQDVMRVDEDTYVALQLFKHENHPSAYKSGGSGSKEGLSLFGEELKLSGAITPIVRNLAQSVDYFLLQ